MSDLPKFEPLPNVGNVVSNRVTSFNQGYNLYQCINYLQGYVSIVYENMDALLDDWNNFQKVINENIDNIATEETQRILNQWLSDGTLNNLIAQNPLWDQKLDKSGGTMTGNIKFSENTKIVGTTPGGNDIDLIHNTNDGASGNYVQFGDPDAKSVINSNQQPVWHNGDDDYLLLTQKQMDDGLAGKVSKSGDTMTGNLAVKTLTIGGINLASSDSTTIRIGGSKIGLELTSNSKPSFYYNNNFNTVLDSNDIVNNLTSTITSKALSAAQGKILNDKLTAKLGNFEFLAGGYSQCLYSNANELQSTETIPGVTLDRKKDICFLSMEAAAGTPFNQVSALCFSFNGNILKINARGSGFVSGHVVRVSYVIFRKDE